MTMISVDSLYAEAVILLQQLIRTPSFSKEEQVTSALLSGFLERYEVPFIRIGNNIIAKNEHYDSAKPVIVLNSHHDTVRPDKGYITDPFGAEIVGERLYGLGSNDAGASLVSLLAAFLYFYAQENLPFNLVMAATAEEEISGTGGVEAVFSSPLLATFTQQEVPDFEHWCAVVGEPTLLQLAVAERGLLVIDACADGIAGHAAREEGVNAVYKAIGDIAQLQQLHLEKVSAFLGPVKLSVTVINTDNRQHNVVPSHCHFVIDVRLNEHYTPLEILDVLTQRLDSRLTPRSTRLRATVIDGDHPLVRAGLRLQRTAYGSPTLSDKALLPFPALKVGPGDSARSHTADEYILLSEIREGIEFYIQLLQNVTF